MAKIIGYLQVDFADFDLNHYKNEFESQWLIEDANKNYEDRYTIFTEDKAEAVVFRGYDFDYVTERFVGTGTVEAFSEWTEGGTEGIVVDQVYNLKEFSLGMRQFYNAMMTNSTDDDFVLLRKILKGDDIIKLSAFDDRAYGYDGNDFLKGKDGNDKLFGGSGEDILKGGNGNDTMYGGSSNDTLRGNSGKDKLVGENGRDDLLGGSENDTLKGGDQDDTLRGGSDKDKLFGGTGDDTFVFMTGDDEEIVKDWEANDTVDLSGMASITDWTDLTDNHMSQSLNGSHVVIDAGNGDVMTLRFTLMESLTEANFDFG